METAPVTDRHEEGNPATSTQAVTKFETAVNQPPKYEPSSTQDTKDPPTNRKPRRKTHGCRHCKACRKGAAASDSDSSSSDGSSSSSSESDAKHDTKKDRARRRKKPLKRKSRSKAVELSSNSESDSDDSASDSGSEDKVDKATQRKARQRKAAAAKKAGKKSKRADTESDAATSSADSSSSEQSNDSEVEEKPKAKNKKAKKTQKQKKNKEVSSTEVDDPTTADSKSEDDDKKKSGKKGKNQKGKKAKKADQSSDDGVKTKKKSKSGKKKDKKEPGSKGRTLEYRRVDELWDNTIHNYKLKESAEDEEVEFDEYIFTVRRTFDVENKYRGTIVDIKSKLLRDALQVLMADVKGVSLVEEEPSLDPNMLFLYLEEARTYMKKTLKAKLKTEKKRKAKKRIEETRKQLKVLVEYLDQDYKTTKQSLYPMLKEGTITFEYLWALFKPNSLAYTPTYGSQEHPRCFKVDYAMKESSYMRGQWYAVEGRYLEYDGKSFGLGDFEVTVDEFKGPRKITSLAAYPLEYHKDPAGIKKLLIERGRRFTSLQGMNYRYHKGLAFMKKKKAVLKVNINGRIMIDPALFRRINPNYPISVVRPSETGGGEDDSDSDDDDCSCCGGSSNDEAEGGNGTVSEEDNSHEEQEKTTLKVIFDKGETRVIRVPVDENGDEVIPEKLEDLALTADEADKTVQRTFTEEELLICSPVVLGFAFAEKMWLEFSLSGVCDIEWDEGAFDSLVLPPKQKQIVKALVSAHKFHAAKTIDDVVQGKGRGLVAVLHGPPGTGKTLTGEGIAELLKCPLYMVSAGELGTDPAKLEYELQKILDIAHSWGAVLLLDEADVFLEQREIHDIHRNALVSIFLRLLEYFQGILFLTTNRVATFDEAFQSRIHVALRYEELTFQARKSVWRMFLDKVRDMEGLEARQTTGQASKEALAVTKFSDGDIEALARRNMNGRQIKNATRTAQAMAVNEGTMLTMNHIRQVLDVAESFAQDLRGGASYEAALHSYN